MIGIPDIFKKYTTQLWYILLTPLLFFVIMVVYRPFDSPQTLDFERSGFYFNVVILMCITLVYLALTRTVLFFLRKYICSHWLFYLGWMILEFIGLTFFFALYLRLISKELTYFMHVAISLQYTFLILLFPYAIITAVCTIIEFNSPKIRERDTIRFTDKNGQVKIVLLKDAILYIKANENYITIFYMEGDKVKDYSLRASMTSISPLVNQFGLYRCHRSFFINVQHLVALRRDPNDFYTAELSVPGVKIPVSRQKYADLSTKL